MFFITPKLMIVVFFRKRMPSWQFAVFFISGRAIRAKIVASLYTG
jgi:hypothetical protein